MYYLVPPVHRQGERLPLVVYHHGAGSLAHDDLGLPGVGGLLRRVAVAGYCVAVSDFGGSLWGNERNHHFIDQLIDDARRTLAKRGPVTFIGSSMGGGAVLWFAGWYPGRVRSVVALQPALDLVALRRQGYRVGQQYAGGFSNRPYGARHSPVIQPLHGTSTACRSAFTTAPRTG